MAISRLLAALLTCLALTGPQTSSAQTRYNVIFLAMDDLNDWVNVYKGHPNMHTPNLDRLAGMGMMFTRAYCSAPSCNPSRASMLTGIRPSTSGVYFNNQPWRDAMPKAQTIPQYFTANNYEVMGTGKIFHDVYNDSASWPVYYPVPPKLRPSNPKVKPGQKKGSPFDWAPLPDLDSNMSDYKIVDRGIEFLNADHSKPFFLAVGITKPHLPWYVPQKYFDHNPLDQAKRPVTIPNDLDDVPEYGVKLAHASGDHENVIKNNLWESAVQGYTASIEFADAQVGRLLDALEKSPYAKNTIIVMFGDHGWNLGEKEHWRKFALWEETTHVPFLMVAPGITRPGSVCDRTVNLMDVYPTLISLCKLPAKKGIEGLNITPLLKQPKTEWNHPSVSTWGRNCHAVRTERWRYIRYSDGSEELYDHNNDPHEWKNLAKDPRFANIKKDLKQWFPKVNAEDAASDNHRNSENE